MVTAMSTPDKGVFEFDMFKLVVVVPVFATAAVFVTYQAVLEVLTWWRIYVGLRHLPRAPISIFDLRANSSKIHHIALGSPLKTRFQSSI